MILLPFRVTSTHSVTFHPFVGSSWGVLSTPGHLGDTWGQDFSPEKAPTAHQARGCVGHRTTGSCTSPDFAAAASLPHYLPPSPHPACFCPPPQALGGPGWPWGTASCSHLVLTIFLGNPSSFACRLPPQGLQWLLQIFLIPLNLQVYSISGGLGQIKTLLKKKKDLVANFFTFWSPYRRILSPCFRGDEGEETLGY